MNPIVTQVEVENDAANALVTLPLQGTRADILNLLINFSLDVSDAAYRRIIREYPDLLREINREVILSRNLGVEPVYTIDQTITLTEGVSQAPRNLLTIQRVMDEERNHIRRHVGFGETGEYNYLRGRTLLHSCKFPTMEPVRVIIDDEGVTPRLVHTMVAFLSPRVNEYKSSRVTYPLQLLVKDAQAFSSIEPDIKAPMYTQNQIYNEIDLQGTRARIRVIGYVKPEENVPYEYIWKHSHQDYRAQVLKPKEVIDSNMHITLDAEFCGGGVAYSSMISDGLFMYKIRMTHPLLTHIGIEAKDVPQGIVDVVVTARQVSTYDETVNIVKGTKERITEIEIDFVITFIPIYVGHNSLRHTGQSFLPSDVKVPESYSLVQIESPDRATLRDAERILTDELRSTHQWNNILVAEDARLLHTLGNVRNEEKGVTSRTGIELNEIPSDVADAITNIVARHLKISADILEAEASTLFGPSLSGKGNFTVPEAYGGEFKNYTNNTGVNVVTTKQLIARSILSRLYVKRRNGENTYEHSERALHGTYIPQTYIPYDGVVHSLIYTYTHALANLTVAGASTLSLFSSTNLSRFAAKGAKVVGYLKSSPFPVSKEEFSDDKCSHMLYLLHDGERKPFSLDAMILDMAAQAYNQGDIGSAVVWHPEFCIIVLSDKKCINRKLVPEERLESLVLPHPRASRFIQPKKNAHIRVDGTSAHTLTNIEESYGHAFVQAMSV
uniref:Uncharacterized protein n=1 Tax=viral metagenome TaxID=1070528 RepID=A0A2V0RCF6_9ZZZZ